MTDPFAGKAICGNWATLLLPINEDESIDFKRLGVEIDALIGAGVDGIYSNGTAGEFYAQTENEFDRVQVLLAEKCRAAGMAFTIGASHLDPIVQLERCKRAAELGPRAIQVILPDWWPVSREEAADYLRMASDAVPGMDIVLYHPPHAKRVFEPAILAEITKDTAVIGIKLGVFTENFYTEAREHLGHLSLMVPGHHLATATREGVAAGAFSNIACLSPSGAQRWTKLIRTDLAAALEIESRMQQFISSHMAPYGAKGFSNAALDKAMAAIGNWADVGTRLRRPYRSIAPSEIDALREHARKMIPELFD